MTGTWESKGVKTLYFMQKKAKYVSKLHSWNVLSCSLKLRYRAFFYLMEECALLSAGLVKHKQLFISTHPALLWPEKHPMPKTQRAKALERLIYLEVGFGLVYWANFWSLIGSRYSRGRNVLVCQVLLGNNSFHCCEKVVVVCPESFLISWHFIWVSGFCIVHHLLCVGSFLLCSHLSFMWTADYTVNTVSIWALMWACK